MPWYSKEQPTPSEPFSFTEHEELYDRISDARFNVLIEDAATTIHKVATDANNYGEFAFVTLSREAQGQRSLLTLWSLGFHEQRERWVIDHWRWYRGNQFPAILEQQLTLEEAQERLEQRRQEIAPYVSEERQSARARLYEMLADLTDEDGAWAELEDLGDAADWLQADDNDLG